MDRVFVVMLALAAALFAALGIVVRQLATRDVPVEEGMNPAIVLTLLRRPLWWAGTATAVLGYGCQALALAYGSLILVQPLLVSALLFALPISARVAHQRVTGAEWAWAVLLTVGLALFVVVAHPEQSSAGSSVLAWVLASVILGAVVIACIAAATRVLGPRRAVLLAIAVGVMFAMIAVLTKVCTRRFEDGGWAALLGNPAPYALVIVGVAATVLQQSAFHAGALQASVPTMLVLEPFVAVLLGALLIGEQLQVDGPALFLLPFAVAAMLAGTVALGRDSGALDERLATSGRA